MIREWILDASPLILLHKINFLEKMSCLSPLWLIPQTLGVREIERRDSTDSYISQLSSHSQVEIIKTSGIVPAVSSWDLGLGESEVLTNALKRKHAGVILDDLQARNCAKLYNLPLKGTVGVVVWAKKEGIINKLKPHFDELIAVGIRIDIHLINEILRAFNEL